MKEGDRLDARYRLESELGHGGMGVVYRAFDERLERPVAVKVLVAEVGVVPGARERFLREARRTAQLRHPNLIEVFDVGETSDGELFFVMELLSGELLVDRAARVGALDLETFAAIALPICDAVGVAHDADVVHRDLKPENVMLVHGDGVSSSSSSLRVKVLDFGIFKDAGSMTKLTDAGGFVGTAGYAAPEQIRGEPLDVRADVYALGVMFHELLAGQPLFDATSVASMIHHHLSVAPRPLQERAPTVPASVSAVVMRCLAKAPELRWASARVLGAALAEALGHAPSVRELAMPTVPLRAPVESPLVPELELPQPSHASPRVQEPSYALEGVEDTDAEGPLELDLDLAPRPAPLAHLSTPPAVPISSFQGSSPQYALQVAPLPPFLAPLGVLPVAIGKRVSAYSLLVAILGLVFFHTGLATTSAFVLISVLAGVGWWVRTRVDASEGVDS